MNWHTWLVLFVVFHFRNISYTINQKHVNHILVYADVVPVALQVSTSELTLKPEPGGLGSGSVDGTVAFRETVTLYNYRNFAAEFTWSPIIGEQGTAFSVRPATGKLLFSYGAWNLLCYISVKPEITKHLDDLIDMIAQVRSCGNP